jgi:hypothetical protein
VEKCGGDDPPAGAEPEPRGRRDKCAGLERDAGAMILARREGQPR